MSIDVLQTCSIGFWVAAGIFFLTAVARFFLMDIPKLYGEISGRTAKKAIEQIRKHNAEALTGDITGVHTGSGVRTEKFSTATLAPEATAGATTVLAEAGATTMLAEAGATTVLAEAGATTMLAEAGATTMLAEAGATTMLTEPEHPQAAENDRQPLEAMDDFVLENELSYAESVEIIE